MREIESPAITAALKKLILRENVVLSRDCRNMLRGAELAETEPAARFALSVLNENAGIAERDNVPVCQDTGMAVVFITLGQEVHITGSLTDAVNAAVREAYAEGGFRMSVLDPLTRVNTRNNTPAVLHTEIVPGDRVKIRFLAKGFGSENMTKLYMLTPSAGIDGVIASVTDAVKSAGSNPCPPVIVGVGIGGTADKAMELSKLTFFREMGTANPDASLDALENILMEKINALKIGAQGFGGGATALAVHILKFPTHIAGLPVAINIQCHCLRRGEIEL
jgi:fumarate hydratase subunit alpha